MGFISRKLGRFPLLVKAYRWIKRTIIAIWLIHLLYTVVLIWMPVWTTPTIIGQWVSGKTIRKQWIGYDYISENAMKAVVAAEDQEFEDHFGFDVEAIEKAMKYNQKHKKKKGASTISQQVAKNVFLWQGRTWFRKGLEVYCTFLIELLWSKERILEVYLNVAEMGDGIFGVEAAAQMFFGKHADKLTAEESAMIAACLPSPIRYKANAPSDYVRKRQRWILWQMQYLEFQK